MFNNLKTLINNKLVYYKKLVSEYFDKPFFRALSYLSTLLSPIVLIDSVWLILAYCFYILILPFILFRGCNKYINKFFSSVLLYLVFLLIWLKIFFIPKIVELLEQIRDLEDRSFIYNLIDKWIGNTFTYTAVGIGSTVILAVITILPFINYLKAYKECIK